MSRKGLFATSVGPTSDLSLCLKWSLGGPCRQSTTTPRPRPSLQGRTPFGGSRWRAPPRCTLQNHRRQHMPCEIANPLDGPTWVLSKQHMHWEWPKERAFGLVGRLLKPGGQTNHLGQGGFFTRNVHPQSSITEGIHPGDVACCLVHLVLLQGDQTVGRSPVLLVPADMAAQEL